MALYSRADSWLGWGEARESDNVLRSLGRIFQISMRGLKATFLSLFSDKDKRPASPARSPSRSSAVILASGRGCSCRRCAQGARRSRRALPARSQSGATDKNRSRSSRPVSRHLHARRCRLAADRAARHRPQHNIYFTLPQTHVVRTAKIHVYYAFSPSLMPQLSHLKLILNGTLFATIQPTPGQFGGSDSQRCRGRVRHSARAAGAQQHAHHRVHRPLHHGLRRPGQHHALGARSSQHLSRHSRRPAAAGRRPQAAAHAVPRSGRHSAAQHSRRLSRAALVQGDPGRGHRHQLLRHVSENRPVRFPVHIGAIPQGNAIVIAENPASLPAGLESALPSPRPTVAMRTNPNDPTARF